MNISIVPHHFVNANNDMDIIGDHRLNFLFYLGGLLQVSEDLIRFLLNLLPIAVSTTINRKRI